MPLAVLEQVWTWKVSGWNSQYCAHCWECFLVIVTYEHVFCQFAFQKFRLVDIVGLAPGFAFLEDEAELFELADEERDADFVEGCHLVFSLCCLGDRSGGGQRCERLGYSQSWTGPST